MTSPAAPVAPNAPMVPNANYPAHPSGSLYVGDLAPEVTEAILFETFSRAGAVSSIRVCRDAGTRRSLGYAYVNFHSATDAERALDTMNFTMIKDRPCRVMWSHRDPSIRRNNKSNVYVKNLHPSIDSKQLYDTFSGFGNILSCKVVTDDKGVSKEFGFVHFETEEGAQRAIDEIHGHILGGRPVHVCRFEKRSERSTGASRFTNVYVKNIPIDWDDAKLTKIFEQFGKVTSVALRQNSERNKSYGFVNFETHEEANKAVDEGGKLVFNDEPLFVDRFQKRAERSMLLNKMYEDRKRERTEKFKNLNLYVKNIEEDVDEPKLREMFATFGDITSCTIMTDDKGVSRGFGFVCFADSESAGKALAEMNGKVFGSKPLYVNRAQRREDRRVQLEHAFMAGQRMHPVAMYFPPNMPMQHMPMMPPQPFGRRMPGPPGPAPIRGYPPASNFYPAGRGAGRPQQHGPGASRGGYAGRGGAKPFRGTNPRYGRDQMPTQQMQPELSASLLASAPTEMQKQILGERLYPLIVKDHPAQAAKITGMFLEMETAEILSLLDSPVELNAKIQEAMAVLEASLSQGQ